jgi:hypothetical protein
LRSLPPNYGIGARVRITRVLLYGGLGGFMVIAATVWSTGSFLYFWESTGRHVRQSSYDLRVSLSRSRPVKWWKLRNITVPDLGAAVAARDYRDVAMEYSWFGGFGPGDVELELEGNGNCELKLMSRNHETPTKEYRAQLSSERVHEVFAGINSTGVLRVVPEDRVYCVTDLGRFDIAVSVGPESRTVTVDERRAIDSPESFLKAREVVLSLSHELGVEFDWGPYATTTWPCLE